MNGWKKILIAVDGTETSKRAVQYTGGIAPCIANVQICLLHVYPEPPPDYSIQGCQLETYQKGREETGRKLLSEAFDLLVEAGVAKSALSTKIAMATGKTISQVVLEVQATGNYGTVVAGKRGVSKAEEFLFGSISNALARHSKDFTSWIVG